MRTEKYILDEDRDICIKREKPNLIGTFSLLLFAVIWSKYSSWEVCICLFFFQYVIPEESPSFKNIQHKPYTLRILLQTLNGLSDFKKKTTYMPPITVSQSTDKANHLEWT